MAEHGWNPYQVETLFRAVNEQLERISRRFRPSGDLIEIICECSDAGCMEQLLVSIDDFHRVRGDPALFIVKKTHENAAVEQVVEEHYQYDIVRKDVPAGAS